MKKEKLQKIIAYMIPIAVFIVILCAFGVRYETNDDATLANLRAGAYGDYMHIFHCNVVYTILMRPLYMLLPSANWYAITQIALVIISFGVLSQLAMEKTDTIKGALLSFAVIIPFATYVLYSFQYTKNSAVIITAGLILIADDLGNMKKRTYCGIALAMMGAFIRYESFIAIGMLSRAMLLGRFFRIDCEKKKKAVVTMLILFALFFGTFAGNTLYYKADADWGNARAYNRRRTDFSDYKAYFLDENENCFADKGITDAQYKLLISWDFWDPDYFTIELLDDLSASVPSKSLGKTVADTITNASNFTHGTSYRYAFMAVAAVGFALISFGLDLLPFIGTYCLFGLQLMYLSYVGRFLERNEVSMMFAVMAFALFCVSQSKKRFRTKTAYIRVFFALMCVCSYKTYIRTKQNSEIYFGWTVAKQEALQQMSDDKDNLYVISVSLVDSRAGYDIWHPRGKDYFSNIVAFGGWLTESKVQKDALSDYGIRRPLADAVDRENVIVIPGDIEADLQFICEMTGKKVEFIPIEGHYFNAGHIVTARTDE